MTEPFSSDETDSLREHGIVVFAQKVIFDAQPPISPGEIAEIQAHCVGAIPQPLLNLWSHTAGGRIAYDLPLIDMGGISEAVSWTDLFYCGAGGYRDLRCWLQAELEITIIPAESSWHMSKLEPTMDSHNHWQIN
jgi:hypothetical protein